MSTNEWITIKEASGILGVSKRTVWRRIKEGRYTILETAGKTDPRMVAKSDILREKKGGESLPALPIQKLVDQIGVVTSDVTRQKLNEFAKELVTNVSQAQKSYIRKYVIISVVVILALVTIAGIYVTRHSDKTEEKIRGLVTTVSQGQEAQNEEQKALKTTIEEELVRAREQIQVLEEADRRTKEELLEAYQNGEKVSRAEMDAIRKGMEAQSAGIAVMVEQIKQIDSRLEEMNREKIALLSPTPSSSPPPVATIPPTPEEKPEEKSSGFLGIF